VKRIIHVVSIDAPRNEVFSAITTGQGLSSWWSTRVEASEHVGGEIRFTFTGDFHPVMQVIDMKDNAKVEWECTEGHVPWRDNTFTFILEEDGGRVRLSFNQEYAKELSDIEYGTYNFNWGYYLNSLKQYCETGRGTPFAAS
jgi:uncharacterized protein YndB with AHSA1/START domain